MCSLIFTEGVSEKKEAWSTGSLFWWLSMLLENESYVLRYFPFTGLSWFLIFSRSQSRYCPVLTFPLILISVQNNVKNSKSTIWPCHSPTLLCKSLKPILISSYFSGKISDKCNNFLSHVQISLEIQYRRQNQGLYKSWYDHIYSSLTNFQE